MSRELADAGGTLAALHERRETMLAEKPSWTPSRCRETVRTLDSLERAIDHAERRVADLDAQQAQHDDFAVAHQHEFDERQLLCQAVAARRLKLTIEAVAHTPAAIVDVLGSRPES